MLDKYGRNIDYLRVSLTDRCNLRCIYCMPEEGTDKNKRAESMGFAEVLQVVRVCASLGIRKVRYTGGEPLVLKGIDRLLHDTSCIQGIEDISITTNGILLSDMAAELKKAGLKRVNISLDTLDENKFKAVTRGGDIRKVLAAIEKCIDIGLSPVKINTVLLRGINDGEAGAIMDLTRNIPVTVRFIELMPIGEGIKLYGKGALSASEVIAAFPQLIPVKSERGGTARMFRLKDSKGFIGFISPLSCKFCQSCNRIRLTSAGTIKPCLHSDYEVSIKEAAGNEIKLSSAIKSAIFNKPPEHHLEVDRESSSTKMMYQIGG